MGCFLPHSAEEATSTVLDDWQDKDIPKHITQFITVAANKHR